MSAASGIIQAIVGIGQIGISSTQLAREGRAMRHLRSTIKDSTVPTSVYSTYTSAKKESRSGYSQEQFAKATDTAEQGRVDAINLIKSSGGSPASRLGSAMAVNEKTNSAIVDAITRSENIRIEKQRYADQAGMNLANFEMAVDDRNLKKTMAKYGMSAAGTEAWAEMGAAGADNLAGGLYMASESKDDSVFPEQKTVGENVNPETREQLDGTGGTGLGADATPEEIGKAIRAKNEDRDVTANNGQKAGKSAADIATGIIGGDFQDIIKSASGLVSAMNANKGKKVVEAQQDKANDSKALVENIAGSDKKRRYLDATNQFRTYKVNGYETADITEKEKSSYMSKFPDVYKNKPIGITNNDVSYMIRMKALGQPFDKFDEYAGSGSNTTRMKNLSDNIKDKYRKFYNSL